MSRKVKTAPKQFISDPEQIRSIVTKTMKRISDAVGSTLGPNGRVCLIESDYFGIPNKNTKDGVTVFKALGARDPYEHVIIEQVRDAATRTASEAGDGTSTSTILAAAFTNNILAFCDANKKFSPQKVVRIVEKFAKTKMLPYIEKSAIKIDVDNKDLLYRVAKVSANGDEEMAEAVISAFEQTGMSSNSHVTIQELSGPEGYNISLVEGFPIPTGFDSTGKFHTAFINDQASLRCIMDNPLFVLFDGQVTDLMAFQDLFETIGEAYTTGRSDFKNIVLVAHGFSESVLTSLAMGFQHPNSINIFPMTTPMDQMRNSQHNFLLDLAAFTGASVFGFSNPIRNSLSVDEHNVISVNLDLFGKNMERVEISRFKTTVVGEPDQMDIEARVEILNSQLENPESVYAEVLLKERIGKLTSGIAKLEVYAGSAGELKEKHDRVEDAVCAVRATINHGALPGGCRILTDIAVDLFTDETLNELESAVAQEVVAPSLLAPLRKLLENAGYTEDETNSVMNKLMTDRNIVFDLENERYGNFIEMGVFDAAKAVEESLRNAISIAKVMGVMGTIVVHPRDDVFERSEGAAELDFRRAVEAPELQKNEADERW